MAPSDDIRKVVSPLSGAMAGLPWHRWVSELQIDVGGQSATFRGVLPYDVSRQLERASKSGRASDMPHLVKPVQSAAEQELADWWRKTAEAEIDQTVAKAIEYGATDLIDIGRNIARLSDWQVTDQEAAELGIFFYLEGKFARWRSAIHEHRLVSDDTLRDIGVYDRMVQRVRHSGGWPGTEIA